VGLLTIEDTGGIPFRAYNAALTYNSAGIEIIEVLPGNAPYDNPMANATVDNPGGQTTFNQDVGAGNTVLPPQTVARLALRLIGPATTQYQLDIDIENVYDAGMGDLGNGYNSATYLRGDIQGDGDVDVFDRLYGQYYLNEVDGFAINDISIVNMASIRHDGIGGDIPSAVDLMYISKYRAGMTDDYYNDW